MNTKELVERRKHRRFKAREGAFAVFRPQWSRCAMSGRVVDISRGGLAFRYLTGQDRSNGSFELDILSPYHGFFLDMRTVESRSDFEIADDAALGSIKTKRCGVQFGDLTQKQISQLEYFIRNFTVAEQGRRDP